MSLTPLPSGAHREKNRVTTSTPWTYLYEIEVPTDPPTRYRLARFDDNVAFRGHTYSTFPISHTGAESDTEANLPETTLTVSNVSRELIATLEAYGGLVGQSVRIMLVNRLDLNSGQAAEEQDWRITRVSYDEQSIQATLSLYNLYRTRFPALRLMRTHCRWQYRGPECGYSLAVGDGGLASCDKSLDGPNGCEVHGQSEADAGVEVLHPNRFGGAPGIPRPITAPGL